MIKKIDTIEAILAINPQAQVTIFGPDNIEWNNDTSIISKADIDAKIIELESEWTANEYARKREAEYPTIAELTIALYDAPDKEALVAKRNAVKAKYPKPS
jgi:hypothetical protein